MFPDEKIVFQDYKRAYKRYNRDKRMVDLDEVISFIHNCVVFRLEDSLPVLNYTIPPHRSSHLGIVCITHGSGTRIIGKTTITLATNSLFIIPGKTVNSGVYSSNTKGYYIGFTPKLFMHNDFPQNYLHRFRFTHIAGSSVQLTQQEALTITSIFEKILEERNRTANSSSEMIAVKIMELIIVCSRIFQFTSITPGHSSPAVVMQLILLIQEHYRTQHSPSFYAGKLNIHPNSLNALVKRHLGQTTKATINEKLLREAQSLLKQTSLSVKEIAYELGFDSVTHFFRFFKQHIGYTPLAYRGVL
jgi:AraC family transcriptional regulator, transcriptional activator of pobA